MAHPITTETSDTASRLVRWELASSRASQALLAGAWGAHAGMWLGLMGDADLAAATDAFYRTTPRWRNDDFVRSGLAPWEAAAVEAWFPPSGRVLVPSAGAAREMLPLAAMGYDVVGFDPSPPLVDFGNHVLTATGTAGTLLHSRASDVPEGLEGPFDAVHFGWGGISHVRWRGTRVAMLRSVRALCADGAPMLISFLTRPPDSRRFHVARSVASAVGRLRGDRAKRRREGRTLADAERSDAERAAVLPLR